LEDHQLPDLYFPEEIMQRKKELGDGERERGCREKGRGREGKGWRGRRAPKQ